MTPNPIAHAVELAELVEVEAHWDNLRAAPPKTGAAPNATKELHRIQKAYESFHAKLVAFNKRFPPGYTTARMLNTPARLGLWCRGMEDLFLRIGRTAKYPAELLAKAYRCAGAIAARLGEDTHLRPAPQGDASVAVAELGALGRWCEHLTALDNGAQTSQPAPDRDENREVQ